MQGSAVARGADRLFDSHLAADCAQFPDQIFADANRFVASDRMRLLGDMVEMGRGACSRKRTWGRGKTERCWRSGSTQGKGADKNHAEPKRSRCGRGGELTTHPNVLLANGR